MMESSVNGIFEFLQAVRTEGERVHRRKGAVVGHTFQQGEARTAVCAGRKRVVPASSGRQHLLQAIVADGAVSRNGCPFPELFGHIDAETLGASVIRFLTIDGFYNGQWWQVFLDGFQQLLSAVSVYDDIGTVVPNAARGSDLYGRTVYRRSETDTLDSPAD